MSINSRIIIQFDEHFEHLLFQLNFQIQNL